MVQEVDHDDAHSMELTEETPVPQLVPVLQRIDLAAVERERLSRRALVIQRAEAMQYRRADLDIVQQFSQDRVPNKSLLGNYDVATRFWAGVGRLRQFADLTVDAIIADHGLGAWMFDHPSYLLYHDVDTCSGLLPWEYARIYQWCQLSKWQD